MLSKNLFDEKALEVNAISNYLTADARIYDRLLEMCVPISCIGVSFRKENAQEKLERLKSLIG